MRADKNPTCMPSSMSVDQSNERASWKYPNYYSSSIRPNLKKNPLRFNELNLRFTSYNALSTFHFIQSPIPNLLVRFDEVGGGNKAKVAY